MDEIKRLSEFDESPEQITRLADFHAVLVIISDHADALKVIQELVPVLETDAQGSLDRIKRAALRFLNRSNSRRGVSDRHFFSENEPQE